MRNTPGLSFFQAPLAVGSPDDVVRDLERYRDAGRVTHLVMWMQLPGMPAQKARRSMELFAKEVMRACASRKPFRVNPLTRKAIASAWHLSGPPQLG